MEANQGRVGATALLIMILVVVFLVFLRPGSSKPTPAPSPAIGHPVRGEQRFSGQADRALGTVTVKDDAEAVFRCPECNGFAITSNDAANPANALNDASPGGRSAEFAVSAGRYSAVQIKTGGNPWTLTLIPDARG